MIAKMQAQFCQPSTLDVIDSEGMEDFAIEAVSDEEIFLAIRYLDPDLDNADAREAEVVSDETVLLAIGYLDPDFH